MLTVVREKGGPKLSLFTTITCFGASFDITTEERRIESRFLADEPTFAFFDHYRHDT